MERRRLPRPFGRDRGGNVAIMAALSLPVALVLAAVAIDEGALYAERRQAQALTDLAAITAAANIAKAERAALVTLTDNGIGHAVIRTSEAATQDLLLRSKGAVVVAVEPGYYSATPDLPAERRFTAGATPHNAVKVRLDQHGTRYFGETLIAAPRIGTEAIASVTAEAAFSVGSRLLRVEDGILNALLGALVGGKLSLKVMDYRGLVDADVEVLTFLDALSTRLDLKAGTYADVLASEASIGQIAAAMADIPGMDQKARATLKTVAAGARSDATVGLSQMFSLGSAARLALGERAPGLTASASALDVLMAAGSLANGNEQVRLDLAAGVPGLASATVDLAIGEPAQNAPWLAVGETGATIRTAQTRLLVTVGVGGPGGLVGTSVRLPISVEIAFAEARLKAISCASPKEPRVTVAARPGIAELRIADVADGTLADFRRPLQPAPARIVTAPLVSVRGQALVEVANAAFTDVAFDRREIAARAVKTVSTRNLTQSLTTSLLKNLELDVTVGGLGIGLPAVLKGSVADTLSAATPAIDDLLFSLLTALGVHLGEADVRVTGVSCGRSVLVQ